MAEGDVIETDPAAGEPVTRGGRVTMVVSRGPEPVQVPDVTALDRREARRALEDRGLRAVFEERETTDEEAGEVLEQDPVPGAKVDRGSRVEVLVAATPPDIEVPDVMDLTVQQATDDLEEAGFEVRRQRVPAQSPDQDGVVVAQDPQPGEMRPPGSTVTLDVGRFEPEDPDFDPGAAPMVP